MKVKAVYQAYSLPDRYVVKTMDDQLKMLKYYGLEADPS